MKARSVKFISVAALLLGSLGVASAAHAGSDVFFSLGVQAPVYVEPARVYVQPNNPVYVNPGYVGSHPVYVAPQIEYRYDDWRRHGWREEHHHARRYGPYGDYDRDGVPNRFDRAPANPYRH